MGRRVGRSSIIPSSQMPPKADYGGMQSNLALRYFKKQVQEDVLGIGSTEDSVRNYIQAMWEAYRRVRAKPDLLESYYLDITKNYKSLDHGIRVERKKQPRDQVDRILYYRANPWLFATDVIGRENIEKTAPVGVEFKEFFLEQRIYLRDALDPRRNLMQLRCNRGGSKTFLIGLAILVGEATIPKLRVTIQAGSDEQARKVYEEYFQPFLMESVLERLVTNGSKGILKRHTRYKHGGWVKVLTASQKSVRGPRPDWLVIDEMCSTEPDFCNAAFGGVVTASDIKILTSSTPDKIAHMFKEFDDKAKAKVSNDPQKPVEDVPMDWSGWVLYHWDCYTTVHITEESIHKAKTELFDSNEFRISMLGLFGSSTGLVFSLETVELAECVDYPEWVENWIRAVREGVAQEVPGILRVAAGIDWGVAHEAVLTVWGIDSDGHVYLLDSFGSSGMSREFRKIVIAKVVEWGVEWLLADGSNAGEVKNLRADLTEARIAVSVTAIPFNKYKYLMIGEIRRRLELGSIHINTKLGHNLRLVNQMKAYEFAPSNVETGGVSEKTVKVHDDFIDSADCGVWAFRPTGLFVSGMDSGITQVRVAPSRSLEGRLGSM